MTLRLSIGGEEFRVHASRQVVDAVQERFGRFVIRHPVPSPYGPPVEIHVGSHPRRFSPRFEVPSTRVRRSARGEIILEGAVRGSYLVEQRRGYVEDAVGLGALDALLRVALSTALPLGGALLLHGAALCRAGEGAVALCGASGSGKSTAAEAFGADCDEMVVLRPNSEGLDLFATPYWQGYPRRAPCGMVVCLERGGSEGLVDARGSVAVRTLARHVVRYVAVDEVERATLRLLCLVCERTRVAIAFCPEGDRFIPFLEESLRSRRGAA